MRTIICKYGSACIYCNCYPDSYQLLAVSPAGQLPADTVVQRRAPEAYSGGRVLLVIRPLSSRLITPVSRSACGHDESRQEHVSACFTQQTGLLSLTQGPGAWHQFMSCSCHPTVAPEGCIAPDFTMLLAVVR